MTDIALYVCWVDDLYEPFDAAEHAAARGQSEYSFVLEQGENEIAQVTLEQQQTGLDILNPNRRQNALFSVSLTGDPLDAELFCRARLTQLPDDLVGETQTITLACAHLDVDKMTRTWAVANLSSGPAYNRLCINNTPNAREQDPEDISALEFLDARSEVFHHDFRTHAISTSNFSEGDRTVNLSRNWDGAENPLQVSYGPPPQKLVKIQADIPIRQEVSVDVDIGPRIFPIATIQRGDVPPIELEGYGWSAKDVLTPYGTHLSRIFSTKVVVDRQMERWGTTLTHYSRIYSGDGQYTQGEPQYNVTKKGEFVLSHLRFDQVNIYTYSGIYKVGGSLSQERLESLYVTVAIDAQSVPVADKFFDMGKKTVGDIYDDPTSDPYLVGREYFAGETMQLWSKTWRARKKHVATGFYQREANDPLIIYEGNAPVGAWDPHPMWEEVPSGAALTRISLPTFLDRDNGQALMQFMALVGRKKLLELLRFISITFEVDWADAHDLTLRDSVAIDIPRFGRDSELLPVSGAIRGKVTRLRYQFDAEGARVAVTLGVSVGTGQDDRSGAVAPTEVYCDPGIIEDYLVEEEKIVGDDLSWTWKAEELRNPIDGLRLSDPAYIVRFVTTSSPASEQVEHIANRASSNLSPEAPETRVRVNMLPLVTHPNLERAYDVAATVLYSPKGVDLTGDGL